MSIGEPKWWYDMMNTMPTGWICCKCEMVMSPSSPQCWNCKPKILDHPNNPISLTVPGTLELCLHGTPVKFANCGPCNKEAECEHNFNTGFWFPPDVHKEKCGKCGYVRVAENPCDSKPIPCGQAAIDAIDNYWKHIRKLDNEQ